MKDIFAFIKKPMPNDKRQSIDIFLWFGLMSLGAITVYLLYTSYLMAIPMFIPLLFVFKVLGINNRIGLAELKKKNGDER